MRPALNGSSALQRFERSNASEIRNGIMFDFYPGLPQIYSGKIFGLLVGLVLYCHHTEPTHCEVKVDDPFESSLSGHSTLYMHMHTLHGQEFRKLSMSGQQS